MAPPVLTAYEESIAFYYELGLAITAWANVERSLLWIVIACFTKHNHTQASLQFLSIENFRSKLLAADRVFSTKYDGTKQVDNWGALFAKLEKLSSLRNHLVHYHTMGYPNGKPGQRYALIPTFRKPQNSSRRRRSHRLDLCFLGTLSTRAVNSMRSLSASNFWFTA